MAMGTFLFFVLFFASKCSNLWSGRTENENSGHTYYKEIDRWFVGAYLPCLLPPFRSGMNLISVLAVLLEDLTGRPDGWARLKTVQSLNAWNKSVRHIATASSWFVSGIVLWEDLRDCLPSMRRHFLLCLTLPRIVFSLSAKEGKGHQPRVWFRVSQSDVYITKPRLIIHILCFAVNLGSCRGRQKVTKRPNICEFLNNTNIGFDHTACNQKLWER